MKKSKVIRVTSNGTWEGKFGLMYKFEIEMDNGDIGEFMTKTKEQTKFIEGTDAEYEFTDGQFPKIKPVYNFQHSSQFKNNKTSDNVQEYIIKQSSLKASVDLCCSKGVHNKEDVIAIAEYFADWVLGRNKVSDLPFADNNKAPF